MPKETSARIVHVVAVSPGDVMAERDALQAVVDELNRHVAPSRGLRLTLWRWETDARPGLGMAAQLVAIAEGSMNDIVPVSLLVHRLNHGHEIGGIEAVALRRVEFEDDSLAEVFEREFAR